MNGDCSLLIRRRNSTGKTSEMLSEPKWRCSFKSYALELQDCPSQGRK